MNISLCGHMFLFLLSKYIQVELLSHMLNLRLTFKSSKNAVAVKIKSQDFFSHQTYMWT